MILVAISVDRLCTLLPAGIYFDPFPFYDLIYTYPDGTTFNGINLQSYCKGITVHASWIILLFAFRVVMPPLCFRVLTVMIVIEFLSLADFFLIYEQYLFKLGHYPVEFTDFRILGHATAILLWKTGKL